VGRVEELTVTGAGGTPLPARGYWPAAEDGQAAPLVVYFHGGGWALCDLDTSDALCRNMARLAGVIVVSVAYRLAPEHRFPIPAQDAYAATSWAAEHAAELGADPARIAIGGDSAGGNLAAATALMARDRGGPDIAHQLLIYPVTDHDFTTASYRDNGDAFFTTARHMRWYWEQYLGPGGDGSDPLASPLRAQDLSGLPSARIVTAQYDPLRDEGEAYAERLRAAGVDATVRRYDAMFHGFFGFPQIAPVVERANEEEFALLAGRLRGAAV
jgi:acetyl esterase